MGSISLIFPGLQCRHFRSSGCWSGGGSSRENHLSWSWRSHSFSSGEKFSLSLPSAAAMRRSHRLSQRSARSPADKGWGSLPAADATRPLKQSVRTTCLVHRNAREFQELSESEGRLPAQLPLLRRAMAQAHQDQQLPVCLSRGDRLIRQRDPWDAVPKRSVRRAQQKLCREPSHAENKGSSLLSNGRDPTAANCTNVPTPQYAECTWGRQATRSPTGPKSQTPRRNHGGGRPTQRGIPQNPQGTSGNPESVAATFFKQWPIRPVLGAAKLRSLRFEATGSRGVLKPGRKPR